MSKSSLNDGYDLEDAIRLQAEIFREQDTAKRVINGANDAAVIEFLLGKDSQNPVETPIDEVHDGKRGMGEIRRAILRSDEASAELKREVATREDSVNDYETLVPDSVLDNALGALAMNKPVVLTGPTGTGKTTFAKQLAKMTCVGYDIYTASPSWTEQDIIGQITPDYSNGQISYRKQAGYVSKGVQQVREFEEKWAVIIDEMTRADISRIFGPLYTAIENPSQTIFEPDSGPTVELDQRLNIIGTMNVSDRTVNELDNAITRRFAMIEISSFEKEDRDTLFRNWGEKHLDKTTVNVDRLIELFHRDYEQLNGEADDKSIIQFGPMHYKDVVSFLEAVCKSRTDTDDPGVGRYETRPAEAVGEAFQIYIIPRLLNEATYPQIQELLQHYQSLNKEFDEFDLSSAVELIERRHQSDERRMGRS